MRRVSEHAVQTRLRRVASALRRARIQAGLSIFELADQLGCKATKVAAYESPRSYEGRAVTDRVCVPSLHYIVAVATACGIEPSELIP